MAILYRSLTIDRMWALLEAHAPFTDIITSARRVTDTPAGWLRKINLRSVGDFPHVQIEMGDNFAGGAIPTATFQAERPDFGDEAGDEWIEERTSEFKLNIVYETPGFDRQDALEMSVIEAFEAAGRSLGDPYIKRWGPWRGKRNTMIALPNDESAKRPVTTLLIPVVYEFTGAQLKPS